MTKTTTGIIIGVVVLIAAGVGLLYALSHRTASTSTATSQGTQQSSSDQSNNSSSKESTAPVATDAVTIQNFAFSPSNITVKKGTIVTWTNKDNFAHTVTETDGQTGPASSDVAPNGTYGFTFALAGTYHYHCNIHSEMTGTVVVTD